MNRFELENLVCNQLKTIAEVWVDVFPSKPASYNPVSTGVDIKVRYAGFQAKEADTTLNASGGIITIDVIFLSYDLRGSKGIYYALKEAVKVLQAFNIDKVGMLSLIDERYLDENNGLWQFGQKWQIDTNQILTEKSPAWEQVLNSG